MNTKWPLGIIIFEKLGCIHLTGLNKVGFKTRIFVSYIILSIPVLMCVSLILYRYLYDGMEQNNHTEEIVKEIPPEKILDMVANMMERAGLIVDKKV